MNYQKIYDALINKAQTRNKPEGYTERHHILPRCLGGLDTSTNLVNLTAREHCLAHLLLAKIHDTKELWCAVKGMSYGRPNRSKAYEIARIKFIENIKGQGNGRFISKIKATCEKTNTVKIFEGRNALEKAGFSGSAVYACLNGRRARHLNHIFQRVS